MHCNVDTICLKLGCYGFFMSPTLQPQDFQQPSRYPSGNLLGLGKYLVHWACKSFSKTQCIPPLGSVDIQLKYDFVPTAVLLKFIWMRAVFPLVPSRAVFPRVATISPVVAHFNISRHDHYDVDNENDGDQDHIDNDDNLEHLAPSGVRLWEAGKTHLCIKM